MTDLLLAESKNLKDFFAKNILIIFGLNSLLLLLSLFTSWQVIKLNSKPVPTLVQLANGEVANVISANTLHREDIVIKTFVNDVFAGFYGWTGLKEEYQNGKLSLVEDQGWKLEGKTVPTSAYRSSFALASEFRDGFLKELSDIVPQEIFSNSKRLTSIYLPVLINNPELLESGKWKIIIVFEVVVAANNGQEIKSKSIPLTKELIIRAVSSLPPKSEYRSDEERFIHETRKYGLEIVSLKDFSENETFKSN